MSEVVIANKNIPFTNALNIALIDEAYTFSQLNTNIADITAFIVGDPVALTGKTITSTNGNLKYDASNGVFQLVTGNDSAHVYVYDAISGDLVYFIDSDTIEAVGVNIEVIWNASGIAQILEIIPLAQYVLQKFEATSGTDHAPEVTQDIISNLTGDELFVIPFTKDDVGVIQSLSVTDVIYDAFADAVSTATGTIHAITETKAVTSDYDVDDTLFVIPFTADSVGQIQSIDVLPTVYDATSTYGFPTAQPTPKLVATRSADFEETDLNIENTGVDAYDIQIQSANDNRALFGQGETGAFDETDSVTVLPFTHVINTANELERVNYKYRSRFVVDGEINGSPVTVNGTWGVIRYTTGKNRTIG
jgi:hypothetical protein